MNILIIDDQPTVVEGILAGVNWDELRIGEKYTANNISQAKEIIASRAVELMLCDIEMPMGSGLDLLEWVNENKYSIQCIFLTSHSDFDYARQAIRLQGFDYLLQPVSYRQIENTIRKAIDKIDRDMLVKSYYSYGRTVKKKEKDIQKSLLRDYLLGIYKDTNEAEDALSAMSLYIENNSLFSIVLIQIISMQDKDWDDDLLMYSMENIFGEITDGSVKRMVFIKLDHYKFTLIYEKENSREQDNTLTQFLGITENLLKIKLALYSREKTAFGQMPVMLNGLITQSRENVMDESGVFDGNRHIGCDNSHLYPDMVKWGCFMQDGYYELLQKEADEYLDKQAKSGHMSVQLLKKFHQDYIYLFFDALRKTGEMHDDIFGSDSARVKYDETEPEDEALGTQEIDDYNYDALMNSYTSVSRIKSMIAFSINYLKSKRNNEDVSESRMEEITEYIHNNIQRNITRKDVAEAVYLNPEYLSRLFRKEKGMKLSEYILEEKMEIAKHLLETTKFPVSIVASKVGYTNFSCFSQCFKRVYGVSPSEYNRENDVV